MATIATVRLLDLPYGADRDYDYLFPASLPIPERGRLLLVPFGTANRRTYALVASLAEESDLDQVKPVLAVLPDRFSLSEEMLGLCFFFAGSYSLYRRRRTALPPSCCRFHGDPRILRAGRRTGG